MGLCLCRTKHHEIEEDRRFWVINVNDDGKKICPGIMELTETCLVFHLKKGGFVKWPYISLVKYGYDSNLFSFACGRRCQTGEGIFGFKCNRAEELFNMLQDSMQNNRISVISDTDCQSPICAEKMLPYRYEFYPSFPATSSVLSSSQRPEPIGSERNTESSNAHKLEQFYMTTVYNRPKCHLSVEKKISGGGISQTSSRHSYFEVEGSLQSWDCQGGKPYQKPTYMFRNQMEKDEIEMLGSLNFIGGSVHPTWDTGYDSDERRDTSCDRRMGYENIAALPNDCFRKRSLVVSVSSSDSQNTNIVSLRSALGDFESQPSSPSVFEDKSSLDQKIPFLVNEVNSSRPALLKRCSVRRDSLTRQDHVPTYFNFDVRQSSQESKNLNYIQVEMENGCDSDNPQTPQSPDTSNSCTLGYHSEIYTEVDLEKTAALSRIQSYRPNDDGTRMTRHNSKHFPV
ncbi:fibroblast growth factor receptor substrate 2-like [Rhinophrynus dorsalis]